jgi:hypothetical protein
MLNTRVWVVLCDRALVACFETKEQAIAHMELEVENSRHFEAKVTRNDHSGGFVTATISWPKSQHWAVTAFGVREV